MRLFLLRFVVWQLLSLSLLSSSSVVVVQALIGGEISPYESVTWQEIRSFQQQLEWSKISHRNATQAKHAHRQNLCGRYDLVRQGTVKLRDALQGLELHPLLNAGEFFHYSPHSGIDPLDPGLAALLLDELARRAGFTWRNTFGVVSAGLPEKPATAPPDETVTLTDLLHWSVEHYDIAASWWDETLERLQRGIAFQRAWFDGSIIMIQKIAAPQVQERIDIWGWLRPFDPPVWVATLYTIVISGVTYLLLEHLSGHRRGRTWYQWLSDNVYLSAIAFPQNYEFQPRSVGARIFGVSISIWSLVMTATHTANLASLLVRHKVSQHVVEQLNDAVVYDLAVCVPDGTGADDFLQTNYRQARRVPMPTERATFDALHDGYCSLTLAYYQNWLGFEGQKDYNPYCNLEWVGRTVKSIQSGFAHKADVAVQCTALIGTVLDIYIDELLSSGFIADLWEQHYDKSRNINCDAVNPLILSQSHREAEGRRRLAAQTSGRQLNVASFGLGSSSDESGNDSIMTFNQLAGTFFVHWGFCLIAIAIDCAYLYYTKRKAKDDDDEEDNENDDGIKKKKKKAASEDKSWFYKQRGLFPGEQHGRSTTPVEDTTSDSENTTGRGHQHHNDGKRSKWRQTHVEIHQTQRQVMATKRELEDTIRDLQMNMAAILLMVADQQEQNHYGLEGDDHQAQQSVLTVSRFDSQSSLLEEGSTQPLTRNRSR